MSSTAENIAAARLQRTVCVICPQENAYSQTFVRAHKENLPATVKSLYAQDYEQFSDDSGPLVRPELPARLRRALLSRSLNLDSQYFQQHALRRFLERNKVEAVLAEFGPIATLVMDACAATRIPLIAHFHGFDAYRRQTLETFATHYKKLFEIAAAIVVVSRDMQTQLVHLGAPADKLHYNSCGVEPALFKGADPLNSPPTFVAVGRFVNKKAPYLTILAFKDVVERVPEARLVMIGDGPLWDASYQLTKALELDSKVEFRGVRSQQEVAETMQQARAFVQHSITTQDGDSEGTPVAVLEASATGLPVVSTRHAGIKDAVRHEETGFLVAEGDVKAMGEYLTRLAKDPQLAAQLGRAGRAWISANYSMDKSINTLWTIIEKTITN